MLDYAFKHTSAIMRAFLHPTDDPDMAVDESTVNYIAGLSRLRLSGHEAEQYATSLTRIMELVEQMNAADTSQVEPLAHPQDSPLALRTDQVTESDCRDTYMAIAPATEDGLYLVPKVIE